MIIIIMLPCEQSVSTVTGINPYWINNCFAKIQVRLLSQTPKFGLGEIQMHFLYNTLDVYISEPIDCLRSVCTQAPEIWMEDHI